MKSLPHYILVYVSSGLLQAFDASATWGGDIPGYPDRIDAYDAREVAMLPHYCIYTQTFRAKVPGGNDQAEIDRWYTLLGPTFHTLHHYCWGLMQINRALFLTRDKRVSNFYLESANRDFDYVLERAPADFPLLPEILTKKGENLIRLGKGAGAVELERAIELKPDYWPPYAALSDYYKQLSAPAKAREILQKGLSIIPDAKPLKTRLSELDKADGTTKK